MSLYYEDFGAVGDGVHDDLKAIIKCHEAANLQGESVKAGEGAVYYIGGADESAVIKTDVDWGNAIFVIDDSNVANRRTPVFFVDTQSGPDAFLIDTPLTTETKHINNPTCRPLYVRIFSDAQKRFIRKGLNMDNGVAQNDCFAVDENGNILSDIDWDYDSITAARVFFADDAPITIQGGTFKTLVNHEQSFYNYYRRGIDVHRSNTLITGVTHYVLNETDHGAPYEGFIYIDECANVTIKDCLLTPHFTYWTESQIPGEKVPMGSYDIRANAVVGLTLENLKQTIDINLSEYWGLMCSNFCKDMTLKNCIISRYDAHMGVTNLNIKDCTFGHVGINLIGHGKVSIENTKSYGAYFVGLREDYGSNFDGELIIKNCFWKPSNPDNNEIIRARNEGDHDFGYRCRLTKKLLIDGFEIDDECVDEIFVLPDYDSDYEEEKAYPYMLFDELDISDIRTFSGREVNLYKYEDEYEQITEE